MATKTLTIPKATTVMKDKAYPSAEEYQAISFPPEMTTIGENAFRDFASLRVLEIPKGVTSIEAYAFHPGMIVYVPNSVKEIGERAFTESLVFFEGNEYSFKGYCATYHEEHPDAFHRGTDGCGSYSINFYFCTDLHYQASKESFLMAAGLLPTLCLDEIIVKRPSDEELPMLLEYELGKEAAEDPEQRKKFIKEHACRGSKLIYLIYNKNKQFVGTLFTDIPAYFRRPSIARFVNKEATSCYGEAVTQAFVKLGGDAKNLWLKEK